MAATSAAGAPIWPLSVTSSWRRIYWRLGVVAVDEDADDLLAQGMGLMQRVDWDTRWPTKRPPSDTLAAWAT